MTNEKSLYGLSTATTMIIGICIGSGIFFKVDDILRATGGNIFLGACIFIIGALSIIFGSISLTTLSVMTDNNGGMVGYFEAFISKNMASAFGWFQTFLYYPTISVVVSWAGAIYTCMLFDIKPTLELEILIAGLYLLLFFSINIFSRKIGGHFQILSTITKMIPLIGIGLIGFFWNKSVPSVPADVTIQPVQEVGWGWLAALAPAAFSYDGWPIALSVTNEVKQPKKNMPLALTIGPLVILAVYLAYFLGMNAILGPEYILSTGNNAVMKIGAIFFGDIGSKILLVFILIAILGVVNGVILGHLRMPHALATKNMIPFSKDIAKINPKRQLSTGSAITSIVCAIFWLFIHYVTQKTGVLKSGDISEIAVVFGYACYLILYIKIIRLYVEKKITSFFKGLFAPVLAILGSLIIVIGGFISNPFYMSIFLGICLLFCLLGYLFFYYYQKKLINK